jgi:PucR family transcriptional regulator, purine catabolism regulatory protein
MPMTVRELTDDADLGLELLVANDLGRPIRWVHTTELADPSRYLQGDEVILTTGVWIAAGTRAAAFVRPLAEAGVAALGFGLPQPGAVVPPGLVSACDRAGLTLFSVPYELPFIAIGEAFVERLAGDRQAALEESVRRNAALVRAAEHGTGLTGILDVLQESRGLRSWVIGPGRQVLARCGPAPTAQEVDAVVAEAGSLQAEYPLAVGGWLVFPIVATGRTQAHLVVAGGSLVQDDRAAIDQALPFLGLELARLRVLRESERRFAAELFDLIAAGPSQLPAASARLEAFGIDPAAPMVGIVCEAPSLEQGLDAAERELEGLGVTAVVASKGVEVVAVAAWGSGGSLSGLARAIGRALGEDAATGVGSVAGGAAALRVSLTEARHACRFARLRRGGEAFAVHDEVGSHMLLLALQDEAVLAAFRDALLRPLEEHDARRHTDLLGTLDAFLGSGGQWQATADGLHIHVNTLRHRLARVEQLTGRSLSSMEDRVDLFIALRSRTRDQ